jgi:hypothetical protein
VSDSVYERMIAELTGEPEPTYGVITLTDEQLEASKDDVGAFVKLKEAQFAGELAKADAALKAITDPIFYPTTAPPPAEVAPTWYRIRPATPEELPSVYESWAGTWRRSRSAGCIPNHLFNEVTFTAITQLLQRGMKVAVLTAKAAPGTALGWIAYERDKRSDQVIVHYLFTKDGFRQRGYGQLLLDEVGAGRKFIYTHQTPFAKYWPDAYHNPGIARRKDL